MLKLLKHIFLKISPEVYTWAAVRRVAQLLRRAPQATAKRSAAERVFRLLDIRILLPSSSRDAGATLSDSQSA